MRGALAQENSMAAEFLLHRLLHHALMGNIVHEHRLLSGNKKGRRFNTVVLLFIYAVIIDERVVGFVFSTFAV